MKRRVIYGMLILPFLVVVMMFAFSPAETRTSFLTEFRHSVFSLVGYKAKPEREDDDELRVRKSDGEAQPAIETASDAETIQETSGVQDAAPAN